MLRFGKGRLDFIIQIENKQRGLWLLASQWEALVKICFITHSISSYFYNALQIQLQKLVQITSNSYAAELQKKIWISNISYKY